MTVNFDGLRKSIASRYNELVDALNDKTELSGGMNPIEVDIEELEIHLSGLRADIAILLCIYDKDQGINSLSDTHLKQIWTNYDD